MTNKQTRPNVVHVRLTDSEYAALRAYIESHPDLEGEDSAAIRKLIRDAQTAAAQSAAARKETAKKEKTK